ncbi:MAG: NAD-dependent epimerase/dehydratase family protein [Candidatus Omnitrophica bacterium]|nr:NAD-dependent epimerase/dehydratase family protein [Candidatus Omnitrophota bacterium]
MRILVTGGAGFIGSTIVDQLLAEGHRVRIVDYLEEPTHPGGRVPAYLPAAAEFIRGDAGDPQIIGPALDGIEVLIHDAATGGFTPHLARYLERNSAGTARLLETILQTPGTRLRQIIVASSIAVYGEGKYRCAAHGTITPALRPPDQLARGLWELQCPHGDGALAPLPTDEGTRACPETPYGISKYDQERLCLVFGRHHDIPVTALRYFVTFGPRQSPTNPYTGVCSIFATRLLNGQPPVLYEDGQQSRDFIFVEDVARANRLVVGNPKSYGRIFNVGTGRATTIRALAAAIADALGVRREPQLNGEFRMGEVRHMVADVTQLAQLGFAPQVSLEEGLQRYVRWVRAQGRLQDAFGAVEQQLKASGIVQGGRR